MSFCRELQSKIVRPIDQLAVAEPNGLTQRSRVRQIQSAAVALVKKYETVLSHEPQYRYDLLMAYSRLTLASRTLGMSNDPFVVAIKSLHERHDFVKTQRPTYLPTDDD
jgi:hypothetical protein